LTGPPSVVSQLLASTTTGVSSGGGGGGGGGSTDITDVDDHDSTTNKKLRLTDISSMRIPELKDELSRRGASKRGNKADLVARLTSLIHATLPLSVSQPQLPLPSSLSSSLPMTSELLKRT